MARHLDDWQNSPITSSYLVDKRGTTTMPTNQDAAKLSALGGTLGTIVKSNPILTGFTAPLSFYDVMYDIKDAFKSFKNKSGRLKSLMHLGLDYPARLSRITNNPIIGKFDDWIPYGGIIDDAIQGWTNKSFEDLYENKQNSK